MTPVHTWSHTLVGDLRLLLCRAKSCCVAVGNGLEHPESGFLMPAFSTAAPPPPEQFSGASLPCNHHRSPLPHWAGCAKPQPWEANVERRPPAPWRKGHLFSLLPLFWIAGGLRWDLFQARWSRRGEGSTEQEQGLAPLLQETNQGKTPAIGPPGVLSGWCFSRELPCHYPELWLQRISSRIQLLLLHPAPPRLRKQEERCA